MNRIKKAAIVLAAGGTALGLIGMGVGASFTDGASATQNIKVGSFGCAISSAQGTVSGKTLTYNAPDIMSSAPGSSPFNFTVTSTGTIPVLVHVTQTALTGTFSSMLAPPADVPLASMASTTYSAGIQWTSALVNGDLNSTASITYTVACNEVPAGPTPLGSNYITDRTTTSAAFPGGHPAQDPVSYYTAYYKVWQCNYATPTSAPTVSTTGIGTNGAPGIWTNGSSHYYVLAFDDNVTSHPQSAPPASACPVYIP